MALGPLGVHALQIGVDGSSAFATKYQLGFSFQAFVLRPSNDLCIVIGQHFLDYIRVSCLFAQSGARKSKTFIEHNL